MIDVETQATSPNAIVLSIGAVFFDSEHKGESFYIELDTESQKARGRRSNPDTLTWWRQKSQEGMRIPGDKSTDNIQALKDFSNWVNHVQKSHAKDVKVWGNGSCFDIPIMESLLSVYEVDIPWSFWNIRDVRTIVDICPDCRYGEDKKSDNNHNSLDDAVNQMKWMQSFMQRYL